MTCPFCDGKTWVIDSRPFPDHVWRRRKCKSCLKTFHTLEMDADMLKENAPREFNRKEE